MSEKSIAIIGAGIAGLSAGCYAQMNGYRSEIFEMHTLPGGVCTSWRRGAYVFDGCIEWLVGVKPGSWTNRLWQELGALEGRRVVIRDECLRIMAPGGKCLVVSSDLDRLEDEMKRLSPGDAGLISALVRGSRRFATSAPPSKDMTAAQKVKAIFGLLPMALMLFCYRRQSIQQFAARFRDPFLRQAVLSIADLPDFPVAGLMMMLGWHAAGDAGYPIGGSLEFSRAIERRYLQLGGKVHYGRRVARILVEEADVATPMTWERYTGNWQASFEGWLLTTRTLGMLFRGGMKSTLPGLRNFYMAGQWVSPGGGVPGVAASARNVMRAICKADKKKFAGQVQKAQAASA